MLGKAFRRASTTESVQEGINVPFAFESEDYSHLIDMNWFTLRFRSKDVENTFMREYLYGQNENLRRFKISFLVSILILIGSGLYELTSNVENKIRLQIIRFGVALPILVLGYLAVEFFKNMVKKFIESLAFFMMFTLLVVTTVLHLLVAMQRINKPHPTGLVLVLLAAYYLPRPRYIYVVIAGWLSVPIYALLSLIMSSPPILTSTELVARLFEVIVANFVGSVTIFYTEKQFRNNFGNRLILRKEMEAIATEKERTEDLLLNVLPEDILLRLKKRLSRLTDSLDEASILFSDIVGFQDTVEELAPDEVVSVLNEIFKTFDFHSVRYKIEKIKSIGSIWMGGSSIPRFRKNHKEEICDFALKMHRIMKALNDKNGWNFQLRTGIQCGPVVAAIVGVNHFWYDVYGECVNMSSRLMSTCPPGKIQVTAEFCKSIMDKFVFTYRGDLIFRGGSVPVKTYFLIDYKELDETLLGSMSLADALETKSEGETSSEGYDSEDFRERNERLKPRLGDFLSTTGNNPKPPNINDLLSDVDNLTPKKYAPSGKYFPSKGNSLTSLGGKFTFPELLQHFSGKVGGTLDQETDQGGTSEDVFHLKRISMTFRNPAIEEAFKVNVFKTLSNYQLVCLALGQFIFSSVVIVEVLVGLFSLRDDTGEILQLVSILLMFCTVVISLYLVRHRYLILGCTSITSKTSRVLSLWATILSIFLGTAILVTIGWIESSPDSGEILQVFSLVAVAYVFFFPNLSIIKKAAIGGCQIVVLVFVDILSFAGSVTNFMFLLAISFCFIVSTYLVDSTIRQNFVISYRIDEEKAASLVERERNEALLCNMIPKTVVGRLRLGSQKTSLKLYDSCKNASIMLLGLVDFSRMYNYMSPMKMIKILNALYSAFDAMIDAYGGTKVKNIGESVLVSLNCPDAIDQHAQKSADLALDLIEVVIRYNLKYGRTQGGPDVQCKIGIHCGRLVGGIVGMTKFCYDIFGPTVSMVAELEALAPPNSIMTTEEMYEVLEDQYVLNEQPEMIRITRPNGVIIAKRCYVVKGRRFNRTVTWKAIGAETEETGETIALLK